MLNFMLEEPSADEEDLDKVEEEGGMNGVEEGGLSSIEVRIVPEDLSKCEFMGWLYKTPLCVCVCVCVLLWALYVEYSHQVWF